jgi:hypothetical protein
LAQAGKDVKENLKNWAKQQEAELAEDAGKPEGWLGRRAKHQNGWVCVCMYNRYDITIKIRDSTGLTIKNSLNGFVQCKL